MTRSGTLASLAALCAATAACASVDSAGDGSAPGVVPGGEPQLPTLAADPGDRPAARVLGKIRLKDVDLTLASTGAGARFAVTPRGEAPTAVPLTEQSLAKHHPEVYAVYRSSLAQQLPYLDARLERSRESGQSPDTE